MAAPSDDWIRIGLEITGHFEDSDDPWGGVSGDFDGMGVSLGVLQWNFGKGSLPPMVRSAGKAAVDAAMPTIGAEFWAACAVNANWRPIVAGWQQGATLKPAAFRELKAFAHSAAFIKQQVATSNKTAAAAMKLAEAWAKADPSNPVVTKALFCWFFDLATQNGGLKDVTIAQVNAFRKSLPDPLDWLCDWLEQRPNSISGGIDARANGKLWRKQVPDGRLTLLFLSYLRSLRSTGIWQVDVMNRKGSLAMWQGKVHGGLQDFTALLT